MQTGFLGPGPGLLGSTWQRRVHHPLQCRPCPSAPRQLCILRSAGPRSGGTGINWASWALSNLLLGRISSAGAAAEQQYNQHQHRRSAATSNHNVASVDSPIGPAALVGASAKQLLQTAVHSLDMFEPRESSTLESLQTIDEQGMDSLEEMGQTGTLATAHIVKANYEVLRLDEAGAVRRLRIKRRDLLREHGLQPRDLRRIDPTIDFTKTSPSITIKEDVLLLNLGGIRAIVTADKALLFEPASTNTRKLLDTLVPRLQASAGQRLLAKQQAAAAAAAAAGGQHARDSHDGELYRREAYPNNWQARQAGVRAPPFELEVLEGVLMVATGRLDAEVLSVTRRVGELLQKLPRDINPVNLEELRRIKQTLVELENKADTLREMLEQIMDDEDELRELNLSSRPRREERRKQRERDRMERQLTRAREEMEQTRRNSLDDEQRRNSSSSNGSDGTGGGNGSSSGMQPGSPSRGSNGSGSSSSSWQGGTGTVIQQWGAGPPPWPLLAGPGQTAAGGYSPIPSSSPPGTPGRSSPSSSSSSGSSSSRHGGPYPFAGSAPVPTAAEASAAARRERLAELYAKHGMRRGPGGMIVPPPGGRDKQQRDDDRRSRDGREERFEGRERERFESTGDPEDDFQDAQDALEELAEQEEEEEELEEVEDLLEYYLQRASATQSEAERLLEDARDLEESIGVSLSARRYEVNRLELMLSMGSFAAALGAMIAGIFGMNMKSTLEMSVFGFWGVTGGIVVGCAYVFVAIMRYTQKKRIL